MKFSLALVGAASAALPFDFNSNQAINDPKLHKMLNFYNNGTWTAGHNEYFDGELKTFEDAKVLLGLKENDMQVEEKKDFPDMAIPTEFDSRTKWGDFIHPIRNQAQCGSCWAFSASEVLSDRFSIAMKKVTPVLSPEDLVSCDSSDMGCQGGRIPYAWKFMESKGLVTDKCFPYGAGSGQAPQCTDSCADGTSFNKVWKAKSGYAVTGVENIQKEIMTNGPVQTGFMVYKSFMTYKSGVYSKHFWELLPKGGHAVKIIGWGVEEGTDYWWVANSWTDTWGLKGFFKIKRGDNQCNIESDVYAGMPDVSSAPGELQW